MKFLEKPYVTIPFLLLVAFVVFFIALGTSEESKNPSKESASQEETEIAVAFDGETLYQKTCIGCHGDQYQGAVGPELKGLGDKYKQEDVEKILKDGNGGMPGGLVPEENIKDMAKFLIDLQ